MLLVGGLLGLGCGKTVYRSHEAQFCSTNDDDDPFYECSPSADLVCINTYDELIRTTNDAGTQRTLPIYLCRIACNPDERCPNGEVCCPGQIVGRNYGRMHACVPATRCDNPIIPDGGFDARPDGRSSDVRAEVGGDSAQDSPVDVPSALDAGDAPVDADQDAGADAS